eukprot:1153744-Pelagomonas_calceolata.AAC.4
MALDSPTGSTSIGSNPTGSTSAGSTRFHQLLDSRLVRVLRAHGGGVALVVVIQHRRCAEAPPVVPVAKGWACGAVGSR